jgi:predicted DNA-binding protein
MPVISVRVSKSVYEVLDKLARENGISLYEYVRRLLEDHVNVHVSAQVSGEVSTQVSSQEVERKLSELTSRINTIMSAISALQEADRELAKRLSEVESRISEQSKSDSKASSGRSEKKTAIEILREVKVRCISDMRSARNPEAVIERMRAGGAVVIRTDEDVCAVDPDYWDLFKKRLEEVKTADDKEVLSRLGDEKMKKLFQLLRKPGALYLDNKKRWVFDYAFIEEPGEKKRGEEEEEVPVDWEIT